jgi:DNA-binding beta-propeller fold protein YncE
MRSISFPGAPSQANRPGRRCGARSLRTLAALLGLAQPIQIASAQTVIETLPEVAYDVEFDAQRGRAYVSLPGSRELRFVDLATGATTQTAHFSEIPEEIALTPDGQRLWLSLPVRSHDDYWFEEDQIGVLAGFDLDSGIQDRRFPIALDPYDLVTTARGQLVVSSGSGQWTRLAVFDGATGVELDREGGIYQATRLGLHPSERIVYGADTRLAPSDIERYDLALDGALTPFGDSPYHGDHRMDGDVWVMPDGDRLITRGGDVFTAGRAAPDEDMIHLRALTPPEVPIDALAFDPTRRAIFTGRDGVVSWYNLDSLESVGETSVGGAVTHLAVVDDRIYAAQTVLGVTQIIALDHPMAAGATNTPPTAAMKVSTANGATTRSLVKLNASTSRDAESDLLYRWDTNDDGIWDTDFTANPILFRRFPTAGSKFVRLRVKDALGRVDDVVQQIDVAYELAPGEPGTPDPGFELPYPVTDVAYDPIRPYAYVSSRSARKVYFVHLATGFVEQVFAFAELPEDLALTPDGARLYVSLPIRDHDSYRSSDQRGFVAGFDLARRALDRRFAVDIDPDDLVATSNGQVVVASGSGQATEIVSYDGATGRVLDFAGIHERTRLTLHPNERIIYAASPWFNLERYDLAADGSIDLFGLSPSSLGHRTDGYAWVLPDGRSLVTFGGDVFTAGRTLRGMDMLYLETFTPFELDSIAFDTTSDTIFTASGGLLRRYDLETRGIEGELELGGNIRHLGVHGPTLYAIRIQEGFATVLRPTIEVPEPGLAATVGAGALLLGSRAHRRRGERHRAGGPASTNGPT